MRFTVLNLSLWLKYINSKIRVYKLKNVSLNWSPLELQNLSNEVDSRSLAQLYAKSDAITSFVWERLNTGHWSEVSVTWRKLFTISILLKIRTVLKLLEDDYGKLFIIFFIILEVIHKLRHTIFNVTYGQPLFVKKH